MRVLITGAGGFVGSHLLARFLRDGEHSVAVLLRPGRAYPRIAARLSDATVIAGDLSQPEALSEPLQRFRPDAIVHAAWALPAAKNRNNVEHADHVRYTVELTRLAQAAGVRHFVGLGSQAEYGHAANRNMAQPPAQPTTLYGTAKLCAGLLAGKVCATLGLRFAWLRLFSAYGPGEDPSWLIPTMCHKFLNGQKPATTTGEQVYDYVYVDDVAEAVHRVVVESRASGFFDLGSGKGCRVRDVIERVRDLVDPSLPIGFGEIPHAPDQVMHMEADIGRLQAVTGWQPQIELDAGLKRSVNWFRRTRGE